MKTIKVSAIRSRPRFKIKTDLSISEFNTRIKNQLSLNQKKVEGFSNKYMTTVWVKESFISYWTPQLRISLEFDEDEKVTIIRGLFGPRPSIWTFFIFLYSLGGSFFFISSIYLIALQSIKIPFNTLSIMGLSFGVTCILLTYIATKIGQRLAKDHIETLREFLENTLIEEKVVSMK